MDVFAVENQALFLSVFPCAGNHRPPRQGKNKKGSQGAVPGLHRSGELRPDHPYEKRFRAHPEFIEKNLLPFGSLKPKQLNALIHAETANQAAAIFRTTSRGKKTANVEIQFRG